MKVARAKLREIGPNDVDMEEYKVREPALSKAARGKRGVRRGAARLAGGFLAARSVRLRKGAGREKECAGNAPSFEEWLCRWPN